MAQLYSLLTSTAVVGVRLRLLYYRLPLSRNLNGPQGRCGRFGEGTTFGSKEWGKISYLREAALACFSFTYDNPL
jgi:hypothetical protein